MIRNRHISFECVYRGVVSDLIYVNNHIGHIFTGKLVFSSAFTASYSFVLAQYSNFTSRICLDFLLLKSVLSSVSMKLQRVVSKYLLRE